MKTSLVLPRVVAGGLRRIFSISVFAGALALAACSDNSQSDKATEAEPPGVVVVVAKKSPFTQSIEFIGETEAFQQVDLRARVTGYLIERDFEEGAQVTSGQLLYKIDPAEFEAALSSAKAGLEKAQAELLNAQQQLNRTQTLVEKETVSQAQLDEKVAIEASAKANVSAAQAEVDKAQLNVDYTEIHAPIAGRIGRSQQDVGNLIGPDSGVLASVVAEDPVRVVFSVSEKVFLQVQSNNNANEKIIPKIRLADGRTYPHPGTLQFVDNQVDTTTGTIRAFLEFPNPDGVLLPGLFVTVLLSTAEEQEEILLPQSTVQLNQTGSFVLVVDGESKVETRSVTTGDRREGEIVILDGLTEGESVIVEGIQKVRPGMTVTAVPRDTGA